MASLPTHLSSTCDSVKNNSLLNYHVEGSFIRAGNTNRDKRVLLSGLVPPTGMKRSPFCPGWCYQPVGVTNRDKKGWAFCPGWSHQPGQKGDFLSGLVPPTGTKCPCPPSGPASLWTRDKSHLLSLVQRQPGQMA